MAATAAITTERAPAASSACRAAFLDDVETNVAAAERVGMYGILVEDDSAAAIAATERLAGLD